MDNKEIKWFIDGFRTPIWENINDSTIIEQTKIATEVLCNNWDFTKLSSWIIIDDNNNNNRCKWYCISWLSIPIVCGRFEGCNNFNRACTLVTRIKLDEHKKMLEDLY